jgi:hypothetical protein
MQKTANMMLPREAKVDNMHEILPADWMSGMARRPTVAESRTVFGEVNWEYGYWQSVIGKGLTDFLRSRGPSAHQETRVFYWTHDKEKMGVLANKPFYVRFPIASHTS